MTTTLTAIIDEQIALIQALTPASLASVQFRVALDEMDLEDWADAEPQAAFRRFTIEDVTSYDVPEVSAADVTFEPCDVELVIAYPNDYRYGTANRRARAAVMREDRSQIDYAIGMWGVRNMSDSSAVLTETEFDELDTCTLMRLNFRIFFYRATS